MESLSTFRPTSFAPPVPQNYEELGIPESLVLDLVLRRLLLEGFSSLQSLSRALKLSVRIVDQAFRHLRSQQLVEVKGMVGNDYTFVLSQAGKNLARTGSRSPNTPALLRYRSATTPGRVVLKPQK
jgi:hypothetical protein